MRIEGQSGGGQRDWEGRSGRIKGRGRVRDGEGQSGVRGVQIGRLESSGLREGWSKEGGGGGSGAPLSPCSRSSWLFSYCSIYMCKLLLQDLVKCI